MRGTFVVMCAVLAVSLSLCFYSMHAQFVALDELDDMRVNALEAVHAGNIEKTTDALVVLANVFEDHAKLLELIASHDALHEAYSHLVDAQISLECNDLDDAYQALAQFGGALDHIREHETFSLANLS